MVYTPVFEEALRSMSPDQLLNQYRSLCEWVEEHVWKGHVKYDRNPNLKPGELMDLILKCQDDHMDKMERLVLAEALTKWGKSNPGPVVFDTAGQC